MKPKRKPADSRLEIRLPKEDREAFEQAAIREGHNTLSAWILYSLRKAERESRPPK